MHRRIPRNGLPRAVRLIWGSIFTRTNVGFTIPRNRSDGTLFRSSRSGTHSGPFVIDPRELVSVIGVRFRPGGAFPFLGTPASELADAHVDLEALWGTSAIELRERLCAP